MEIINQEVVKDYNEEVGGLAACVAGCGTICYLTAGGGLAIAAAAYLL